MIKMLHLPAERKLVYPGEDGSYLTGTEEAFIARAEPSLRSSSRTVPHCQLYGLAYGKVTREH